MVKKDETGMNKRQSDFSKIIGSKETKKINAKKRGIQTIWYGMGMMGLVGWSICLPTLLGVGLGSYLDHVLPIHKSWTLIFFVVGLILGCYNTWRWLRNEDAKIQKEQEKKDD